VKKYSQYFNKKSRFLKTPELMGKSAATLDSLNPAELESRLQGLLKIQNDFYPCFDWSFPPPLLSPSSAPATAAELFSEASVVPGRYSLYLHSPFCKTLCSFCYYSVIPGRGIDQSATYIDYLVREMALYADAMAGQICESVYFGGGTPTYLDDALLVKVFEGLRKHFVLAEDAEISIEASPGTLPREKVKLLKTLGVTRLSYGIQTLDEQLLATMNRHYSVPEAIHELDGAIDLIGNVNVDTMYGFEGEPDHALLKTLEAFHQIDVPSLSIYALDRQRSEHKNSFVPPKDDAYEKKIQHFSAAKTFLGERGYRPVLQNVFAIPGKASYRHQIRRWDNLPLLSLGIASQGYAPQRPYQNIASIKSYYEAIDLGRLPVSTVDHLSPEMELCRELTSKLRFTQISMSGMRDKYGVDVDVVFRDLINVLGDMDFISCKGDVLKMTEKSAYYNNIIPMLFSPDSFKQELLGLPEEYIEEFPVPYILTRVGHTQSAPVVINTRARITTTIERRMLSDRRWHAERRCQTTAIASEKERRRAADRRQKQEDRRCAAMPPVLVDPM